MARKMGRKARSRQSAGAVPRSSRQRPGAGGHAPGTAGEAGGPVEPEALSATHWFENGGEGDDRPYSATVRFSGHRVGVHGRPGPRDAFVKEETVDGIVRGSGPVSLTTWVYGLQPGEWTVTASLVPGAGPAAGKGGSDHWSRIGAQALPAASWSWLRRSLSAGPATPIKTRPSPFVRLTRVPAVIHGSWSAMIALGILVGVVVQSAILARSNVSVGQALIIDAVALLGGLLVAKLWYLAFRPRTARREPITEGWTVDGLLAGAVVVGLAVMLALDLPPGAVLDASAPALFTGVAIGRLGCFFTGCCAGRCTRSRWGLWSSDRRVGARRVPTQLLESAAGLAIAVGSSVLLLQVAPMIAGTVFVAAASSYMLVRQALLRLRADPHNSTRARVTAAIAAIVLLGDLALILVGPTLGAGV